MRSDTLRRVWSASALATLAGGVPCLLAWLGGWPLPRRLPAVAEIRDALDGGWAPTASFVVGVVTVTLWLLWAYLMAWVVAEARRARREGPLGKGRPPGRRRRGAQLLAALLVRGVLASGPVLAPVAHAASTPARLPHVLLASGVTSPGPLLAQFAAPEVPAVRAAAQPSYVVRPWAETRDCLWVIAGRYLGDPFRWTEIYDLNRDRAQPDGRTLGTDPFKWVYPGWTLVLPADAAGDEVVRSIDGGGGEELRAAGPPSTPAPVPVPSAAAPAEGPALPPRSAPPSSLAAPATTTTTAFPRPPAAATPPGAGEPSGAAATGPRPTGSPGPVAPATTTTVTFPTAPAATPRVGAEGNGVAAKRHSNESPVASAARLLLPPVIAGAVLAELGRRALLQHRRRRRGRQVARPSTEARAVERRLRAVPETESAEWVDLTMRYLARGLVGADGAVPPAVVCVRAGALGVEIVVDPPTPAAPPGFGAEEEGRLWRLDPAISLAELRQRSEGGVALVPALLTIGSTDEGCVLVNLEAAGSLSVEGDNGRVTRFLAGAALELATAPWAAEMPLNLVKGDTNLVAGSPRARVLADLATVAGTLVGTTRVTVTELGETPTTLAARVADESADDWAPTATVAAPGSGPPDDIQGLVAACEPHRSGAVCVVAGPVEGARWRLVIDADGRAVLHPLGLEVDSHLDGDAIEGAGELLAARADTDDVAPVVELVPTEADAAEPGGPGVAGPRRGLYVRLLRRRPSVDWPGAPPDGGKAEEAVLYLAAAEGPVGRDRLRAALWPMSDADPFNERTLNTLRSTVSRARTAAGADADGNPVVLKPKNGYYGLARHGWSSDWREFQALVHQASRTTLSESLDLLAQALSLVEDGVPLSDVPSEAYSWALTELQDVFICKIVDAAEALAEQALEAGDPDLVELAARKGLGVSPCRDPLWRARMQAAADRGDRDALKRAYDGAWRAARSLDPLAEPDPETMRLYHALQRSLVKTAQDVLAR